MSVATLEDPRRATLQQLRAIADRIDLDVAKLEDEIYRDQRARVLGLRTDIDQVRRRLRELSP